MKVNIEVIEGPDAGQRAEFDRFPIRIGRAPECDMVLIDPTVSARHAFLLLVGDKLYLEDIGGRGSTRVDDAVVTKCPLPASALVGLGATELKVCWQESHFGTETPDTGNISDEDPLTPTPCEPLDLQITVIPDEGPSRVISFRPPQMIAGRQGTCEIPVEDPLMSRNHFRIRRTVNAFVLDDLNSANGTFVDEEELTTDLVIDRDLEIRAGATRFPIQLVRRTGPVVFTTVKDSVLVPSAPEPERFDETGERRPTTSSLPTAPGSATFRIEKWDEQTWYYSSIGPQPPLATILLELSRRCPLAMLVNMIGPGMMDDHVPASSSALLEDSWGGTTAGSPTFVPPDAIGNILQLAEQLSGHDSWVCYFAFADPNEMLLRLRSISARFQVADPGETGIALLSCPSRLSDRLRMDHALARDLLAGWKAIVMERPSPGGWLAIAGPGFRRVLERAGLEDMGIETTEIPLADDE